MTDFPFEKNNSSKITKIGTGGGWVKGSTGYSFKHTEKKIKKIIENIKSGYEPSKDLFRSKYKFYDAIFLDVLARRNDKGEQKNLLFLSLENSASNPPKAPPKYF